MKTSLEWSKVDLTLQETKSQVTYTWRSAPRIQFI